MQTIETDDCDFGETWEPKCRHCKGDVERDCYSLGMTFDTERDAKIAAALATRILLCDVHAMLMNDCWQCVVYDSCAYQIVGNLMPAVEFDPCNGPHHYLGAPHFASARNISLLEAIDVISRIQLEDGQKILIEPNDDKWTIWTSLNSEQNETVRRLANYFEDSDYYERGFDQIDDYDDYVRTLSFAL